MNTIKEEILNKLCYTELVYKRINKKLSTRLSKREIEEMIFDNIKETHESFFQRTGKNIYISNLEKKIKITINANTYRIITVDKITKTLWHEYISLTNKSFNQSSIYRNSSSA